jgi:hypothetical protein
VPITLITIDDEESLPDDDDALAFVMKERICRDEMNRLLPTYGQNDDDTEVWMEYVIQVRAAAAAYGYEDRLAPRPTGNQRDQFWHFYETAVATSAHLTRQSRRDRSESVVVLTAGEKARLAKHLGELRAALEASSLSEKLKVNLRKRLDAFEGELERESSSIAKILVSASLVVTALGSATTVTLSAIGQMQDIAMKLPETLEAITRIASQAKNQETERAPEQKALPEQKKYLTAKDSAQTASPAESKSIHGLEDEVPF